MNELFAHPVVSLIVQERGALSRILLQKRVKEEPAPLKLLWELPQGRLRAGESLLACAVRELREETGLENIALCGKIKKSAILGESLEAIHGVTVVETGQHSYLAVCVVCSAEGIPRSSEESCDPMWLSREQVLHFIAINAVFPLNVPMLLEYYDIST